MRIFECSRCQHAVFFESVRCVHCGAVLATYPEQAEVLSLEPEEIDEPVQAEPADSDEPPVLAGPAAPPVIYRDLAGSHVRYKLCDNSARYGVCNAALPADSPHSLCEACRLNAVIPDLSQPGALDAWQAIERAKRRLIYTLRSLRLPIGTGEDGLPLALTFSFMGDDPNGGSKVLTGHDAGHITLNIAEADAPFREKLRQDLGEGYRTLLGHFRHEIGHFYWDALIKDSPWLPAYRSLFGDEQQSYEAALARHYEEGPPFGWHERFVSAYATMHPWEDWAETWAHYLHIVDTLDTARAHGLTIRAEVTRDAETLSASPTRLKPDDFADLLAAWVPLTVTLNSLNRSMGLSDPYPFVLTDAIAHKLHFVHDVIHGVEMDEQTRVATIATWEQAREEKQVLLPGANDVAEQQGHDGDGSLTPTSKLAEAS
jgi:hypothetical protein